MENIDFSAFSKDDFDAVQWLNSIFSTGDNTVNNNGTSSSSFNNQEMAATNLVYKLQLMVEETNHSLEEIAQRMAHSVPKVIAEAEVLGREAAELLTEVVDVRSKMLHSADGQQLRQSEMAVEQLSQLDQAKGRLQETYKALQEANNWTTLTADVEEVFESGDTEQIAGKLTSMQKSLEVLSLSSSSTQQLSGSPNDLKEKLATLETLKDRFEKLVEPVLVGAFLAGSSQTSSSSSSPSKSIEFYSKLFRDLHRSDRLLAAYHRCLRDQLLKEWSTTVRSVEPSSEETLLNWLNTLYDRLTVLWRTQMPFCRAVLFGQHFGMSLRTLCDIYTDALMSLDPSIETCLEAHLQRQQTAQLKSKDLSKQKALIQLKTLTNAFMRSIEANILEQYSGPERANDFVPRVSSFDIFIRTAYRPLAAANETFLAFERDRLKDEFESYFEVEGGGEDGLQTQQHFSSIVNSECVIKLFVAARASLKLYSEYVQSYPILVVDQAIEPFLLRFFAHFKDALEENINRHLKSAASSNSSSSTTTLTPATSSSHRRNNSASGSNNLTSTSSSKGLKSSSSSSSLAATAAAALFSSSTPNWQVIQQALIIFQIIGEFTLQLEKLQQQVHTSLVQEHQRCSQGESLGSSEKNAVVESSALSETETKVSDANATCIFYFNRFDIFILNLDSNIELRDQIEGYLQSPLSSSRAGGILAKVDSECTKAAQASGQAVLDAVLDFVNAHLSAFMATVRLQLTSSPGTLDSQLKQPSSEEEDADSLSFSPTEYITQIGQYLLTLPQHLEPFNPNENEALKCALKHSVDVFTGERAQLAEQVDRIESATTELLLDAILRHTTRAFLNHLLKLSSSTISTGNQQTPTKAVRRGKLSQSMRKQIAIDLSYLVAVCEDLGLSSSSSGDDQHGSQFALLVQVFNEVHSREQFQEVVKQHEGVHAQMLQLLEEILPF